MTDGKGKRKGNSKFTKGRKIKSFILFCFEINKIREAEREGGFALISRELNMKKRLKLIYIFTTRA